MSIQLCDQISVEFESSTIYAMKNDTKMSVLWGVLRQSIQRYSVWADITQCKCVNCSSYRWWFCWTWHRWPEPLNNLNAMVEITRGMMEIGVSLDEITFLWPNHIFFWQNHIFFVLIGALGTLVRLVPSTIKIPPIGASMVLASPKVGSF